VDLIETMHLAGNVDLVWTVDVWECGFDWRFVYIFGMWICLELLIWCGIWMGWECGFGWDSKFGLRRGIGLDSGCLGMWI